MEIISETEDTVTRRVTKFQDDETSQVIILSEFYKDDVPIGKTLRSDSFGFEPDPDIMFRMRDAILQKHPTRQFI